MFNFYRIHNICFISLQVQLKLALMVALCLLSIWTDDAVSKAKPPQTINIFTVDNPQPGFGDLVSNWYAAQVLKQKYPQLHVNIYISSEFHDRFELIEPEFSQRKLQTHAPLYIKGIMVYWHTFAEEYTRNHRLDIMLVRQIANHRVCNVAFTAKSENIIRRKPVADEAPYPTKSWGAYMSEHALSIEKNTHLF